MASYSNVSAPSAAPQPPDVSDIPLTLLNSFLPGFGVIRTFILTSLGFDITIFVSAAFLLATLFGGGTYVWRALSRFWFRWFSCSIAIDSHDSLYDDVMEWISKHAMTERTRDLTASSRGSQWDELEPFFLKRIPIIGEYFNFEDFDSLIPPMYVPSAGSTHSFYHNGRYFQFFRDEKTTESAFNPWQGRVEKTEKVHLTCLGRSAEPLKNLLLYIKRTSKIDKTRMTVVRHPANAQRGGAWATATKRPSRPMSTIYLDEEVKDLLLEDASEFLLPTSPRFYARRGIPYRRGYLFYGLPGTGKTSLSFALAGVFGLKLHVLSLVEPTMNDQRLMQLFSQLPARCIVLLEDVDAAGLSRKSLKGNDSKTDNKEVEKTKEELDEVKAELDETKKKLSQRKSAAPGSPTEGGGTVTLSGLLNALDGVASQEGRILVMTTNAPEDLDPALIRPGRVDRQIYFGNVSRENAKSIFERMFSSDFDEDGDKSGPRSDDKEYQSRLQMAEDFAEQIPDMSFTPAEVQGFLLTRRKDPRKALADVAKWRDETLVAKETGKNVIQSQGEKPKA